jgi:hypothetical protein
MCEEVSRASASLVAAVFSFVAGIVASVNRDELTIADLPRALVFRFNPARIEDDACRYIAMHDPVEDSVDGRQRRHLDIGLELPSGAEAISLWDMASSFSKSRSAGSGSCCCIV